MKTNYSRIFLLTIFSLVFFNIQNLFSQATFTAGSSDAVLLTELEGSFVTLSNATLESGNRSTQVGVFSNGIGGANFQIDSGIIFTSGTVVDAFNSNTSLSSSLGPGTTYNDPELISIDPTSIYDVVVFSFDVVIDPGYSALEVTYQFGAEEYPDYTGSVFNDVFGFFVSGPGITGSQNIALVPGTTNPVSVNYLNAGFVGCQDDASPEDLTQAALYINNGHSGPPPGCNTNPGPFTVTTQYNGISNLLTSVISGLTAGVTYRFKMALADTGDGAYDTGVYIDQIIATGICNVTDITMSNITACYDNGTDMDPSDDYYTADVIVNYLAMPLSGDLILYGDASDTVSVATIGPSVSYTFTGVQFPADGSSVNLNAAFTSEPLCYASMATVVTAPASCSPNLPPTITQPPIGLPEDSFYVFCPVISDPNMSSILLLTSCGDPLNGTATIDAMNCVTYTPNANYNGTDSMCLIVCDNGVPVLCDSVMVPITVMPVNDAPTANDDVTTTNEDTPVLVDVPTNDNDDLDPLGNIDSTTVSTTGVTGPINGTITNIDPLTGEIEYTPNAGYNGIDSFEYIICDDGYPLPLLCDTAWVLITVSPVNDTPTISQPPVVLPEDSTYTFCPVITDPDTGDVLTISSCGDPLNGTATIDAMNCVTYTPNANYNGTDSMCLIVCDNGVPVLCDSVMVPITVMPVNDAPTANDDATTTNEDTPVLVDVPTNDNDDLDPLGNIDSTTVSTTGVTGPINGTITNIDPLTGEIEYTPNAGYNGIDSFEYIICDDGYPLPLLCDTAWVLITVSPVNDTPTISQPPVVLPEDSTYTFCPVITDPDTGDVLTISSCGDPLNGTATIDAMNCVTYTPNANYNGTDSMCLIVCDNGVPVLCDSVMVPITVMPVNDAPTANDDATTTNEDTPVLVDVPTNDNDDLDPLGNIDSTTVSTTGVTGPINGTITNIDPLTGEIEYTPNAGYNGIDSFEYIICDDGYPLPLLCDTAWVLITVSPVNDTPTISQPPVVLPEDSTYTFCPVITDPDTGDVLTISSCGDPLNGTATIDAMNCVTYTPNANYNGTDSMCLIVCDNGVPVLCDSVMVPITVMPVNDAPTANDDVTTTNEDTPVLVDVPTNDNDDLDPLGNIDSTTVSTTGVTGPINGTITNIDPLTGEIEYTPNAGYNGIDSFEYIICDDGYPLPLLCDTAWVLITVSPVNDTPTISQPPVVLPEDSTYTFCPVITDPDTGDVLTISSCGDPLNGTATIDAMNCVTYTPNANYNGTDSMCLIVCDNGVPVLCDSVMVPITVMPVNDAPTANDDATTTNEDTPVLVDVPTNDNDDLDPLGNIDSTTVSTTGVTGPINGTITNIDPLTGEIEYTPNAGYNGIDSFEYIICDDGYPLPLLCDTAWVLITVSPVNDTPTISQPPVVLPEDSTYTFCPVITDPDTGDVLTISSCGDPLNGTATIDAMNCVTYTPNANYNGTDSMCLIVCDNGVPVLCDSVMVPITVMPVNDAPTANDDATTTNEDTPVLVDVPTNDNDDLDPLGNIDSTTVSTTGVTGPINGTITNIDPLTGEIEYTPNAGYNGIDSFEYIICDDGYPLPLLCDTAWVLITVSPVNDTPTISQPPVVLPEDSTYTFCPVITDPDTGDVLTISSCGDPLNGTATIDAMNCVTYTPNANYNGTDSMCLIVCDNGVPVLCDSVMVPITVMPVNDAPTANDDATTTNEDTPVLVDVPTNDNDDLDPLGNIDSTTVSTTGVTGPINGTITNIDPLTGEIEYTPNAGYNGIDSFEYIICDDGYPLPLLCDTAWVLITVSPVNDTPTISQPPVVLPEDSTYTFCPVITDPDTGDVLTISSCGDPLNGTATIDAMNCVTYTPNANYNGTDSMCLIVCDNGVPVLCDSVMVPITVMPVNDAPTANDDATTTNEDTPVLVDVPTNDNDDLDPLGNIDSTTVSTTGVTGPINGTITNIDPLTGEIEYTPNAGYNGIDSFEYIICDDGYPLPLLCDTAWVLITVSPVNDTPTISQPPVVLPEDSTYTFCPVITDPDTGDVLTISSCGDPLNGTATIDAMNCVTYTPNANYNGTDSMCLIVCDNGVPVLCDSVMVPITVMPVNDAPTANDDATTTNEDTPVLVDVPTNDNDDLDPLGNIDPTTVDIVTQPDSGTVVVDLVTGEITYTPNPGFEGIDSFQYAICDDGNPLPALCDTAWIIITVAPVLIDTDLDGVTDGQEMLDGTDYLDPCDFIEASITFPVLANVNCDELLIPTGFSPNGDGVNDYFVIKGIENYPNAKLIIINRWGNKVYETENGYNNDWNGRNEYGITIGTRDLPVGTYFLILDLGDDSEIKKGYVYLNR